MECKDCLRKLKRALNNESFPTEENYKNTERSLKVEQQIGFYLSYCKIFQLETIMNEMKNITRYI